MGDRSCFLVEENILKVDKDFLYGFGGYLTYKEWNNLSFAFSSFSDDIDKTENGLYIYHFDKNIPSKLILSAFERIVGSEPIII